MLTLAGVRVCENTAALRKPVDDDVLLMCLRILAEQACGRTLLASRHLGPAMTKEWHGRARPEAYADDKNGGIPSEVTSTARAPWPLLAAIFLCAWELPC